VKVRAPVGGLGVGKEEHQVRVPVAGEVAQITLFRHHESHCAGFGRCDTVRGTFGTGALDHLGL
jgi:hypothetical protein